MMTGDFYKRACATLLLVLTFYIPNSVTAETIRVSGTGSSRGIMWVLRDAYARTQTEDRVFVAPPMGSSGGLKALDANAIDIAIISRTLPKKYRENGMVSRELGKTPFIIIANNDVPATVLSLSELGGLYDGSQTLWSNGHQVRPVMRPPQDSDNDILKSMSRQMRVAMKKAEAREGMVYGYTDTMAASEVENIPGAFSTSTLALVLAESRKVKVFKLDGIKPTPEAVRNGDYNYTKTLYFVTRPTPSTAIQRFTDFLRSKAAKNLLEKNGVLPKE